ncbi:MAG: DUF1926 domain-containing protein, partial [Candidatus Edwardsbacteria bacterium]|nr:DUF1926 domain-containing protein [Candidatus Edwardsbacteria bacterium]
EEAYQKAYKPFLDLVGKHPWFKFALHNSGCLWEWLKERHPEYLDAVRAMVSSGQVELMGGGFYEPILPAIPERDRQGQIAMMSEFLKTEFGASPEGAWVAERVWEPSLASTLAEAGIKYTVLDDAHFKSAGRFEDELDGYYLTDDQGKTLVVFPISQKLRYLVPFHPVDEAIHFLKSLRSETHEVMAILADDGEKFGVWPGTHELAYKKGWLKEFLAELEKNRDWLEMATFSEAIRSTTPKGRIYLPTGSYTEMGEWVLEPRAQAVYRELVDGLKREGSYEKFMPFIKGGIWRNFLTKYPEANNLYRKMLLVSDKVRDAGTEARRELYRGQCNCAYWHGIFGGLYLPHLREALYRHLIRAENLSTVLIESPKIEVFDFDGDGHDEILLSNEKMNLYLAPAQGGTIFEWDLRDKEYNLLDALSRRPENYHAKIKKHRSDASGAGKSIHEAMAAKESGLDKLLHYDDGRRAGLVSRLLSANATLDDVVAGRHYSDLLGGMWEHSIDEKNSSIAVALGKEHHGIRCEKRITFKNTGSFKIGISFKNENPGRVEIRPAVEFNLGLLSSGFGRYCRLDDKRLTTEPLDAPAEDASISQLSVHDNHRKTVIDFSWDKPMDLWRYPVETVSQSEAGFERNYQCSCFLWHCRIALEPGASSTLTLTAGSRET